MADQYDIFFEAHDGFSPDQLKTFADVSGITVLQPEGTLFTWVSPPSPNFNEGQRVLVWYLGSGIIDCVVKKVVSSTQAILLPIQSTGDLVGLPYTFPSGSRCTTLDESAAQQVIDLSEAPGDSYDYLFVSCGTFEQSLSPGDVSIEMMVAALQGDPYSGIAAIGSSRVTLSGSNPDRPNFVASTKQTLLGGQRYEQFVKFTAATSNGQDAIVSNARILALRVTGGFLAGDGKTAEQTTTLTSYQDHLDLGPNLPAGQYLICSTWALGSLSGVAADCDLEADGSTVLANQVSTPSGASNYLPGGFFGLVTLGGTNRVRLRYKSTGGGAVTRIRNAFLCAIPIANIPAFAAFAGNADLTTNFSLSSSDNSFHTLDASNAVTLQGGRHIEVISASLGGDNPLRSRPNYGGASVGTGLVGVASHNVAYGVASTTYLPTFWLNRIDRDAGSYQSSLEMRRNTGVTTLLRARDVTYSWMREQPDFLPEPDEEMAIVANIEMGVLVLKSWNSTTTTNRYSHRLSEKMLSRVRVNGSDYTRVASLGAMAAGTWFWDPTASDVYVQLTTAHAAIGTGLPSDSGINVSVVPLLLAGRKKENLVDPWSGNEVPYQPLLKDVPSMQQTLQSTNVQFSAASQIGTLKLVAQAGQFDDALGRPFDSYRVKLFRGYPRKTTRLADYEVIADCVQGPPSHDITGGILSLRLLDRRRLMQTPIANTRVTVREGYSTDGRNRDGQFIPVIWGPVYRQVAYRITQDETSTGWNEYQFVDHAVKVITAVYLDGTTRIKVATGNLNVTSTYAGVGKVRMNNAALGGSPANTQPPDVIYVDFIGRTSDGTVTGAALMTPGTIARDIATNPLYGNMVATRLVERTFRMIDRSWRWNQVPTIGRRPIPPKIALIATEDMTVETALTTLTNETPAYWLINHQDRLGLDVPDFDRGNLIVNGGFEDTLYPWKVQNSATIIATTARKYEGTYSAEISNGSPVNTLACAYQAVALPAGGKHAITLLASLLDGVTDSFRIGVIGPSGIETLSDPQTLETGRWTRHSVVYESEVGDAGYTEVRIYPAYGSSSPTRVAVDKVETYRIACVIDDVRSIPTSVETEDEHYFAGEVPFARNEQDNSAISTRTVSESEARGLASTIEPEGKYAVQSSTRATLSDARAGDADSAGGIAAPIPLIYSRNRMVLGIPVFGLDRIPLVGDYVFHRRNRRVPESPDGYPIWRISDVAYDQDNAKTINLKVWHHNDPVADRIDITPDSVPMGGIGLSRSPAAMTDFTESGALGNQFVKGTKKPDVATQLGSYYHFHPLTHLHDLPLHHHVATLISHGIDAVGDPPKNWIIEERDHYEYPSFTNPQAGETCTRGLTDGGHNHSISGAANVADAAGTSSAPNVDIFSAPGPIEPSYIRVRCMQRTGAASTTIDPNLIVGLRSTAIPAGWKRVVELDNWFLRGATTNAPMATTTTATFTPTDTGSTIALTSGTGAYVGRRLTVAKSGSTVHVVLTAGSGTSWTAFPLHETSDVANGSFPTGSGATVTADAEVIIRTNVATSTYVPNDASSTLIVASGTGIAIGSLLSVVNTADSNKLVHVRVTAGSGTSWTVVPLHLSGDQANAYSPGFPASANTVVIDSEFRAPTHKHGGTMPSHQHSAGGHGHQPGAASFITGPAGQSTLAQKYLGGPFDIGIAASDGHAHLVNVVLPGSNQVSVAAAGTLADDLIPVPPFYELVFIQPVDAFQKVLPAGAILFWTQSNTPPTGYSMIGEAKNLLIKGAPSGAGPGSGAGGHVHTQTNTAHTISHNHGGTVFVNSKGPGSFVSIEAHSGAIISLAAGEDGDFNGGHAHLINVSVSSFDPGLSASSGPSGDVSDLFPLHKAVMLIQKS